MDCERLVLRSRLLNYSRGHDSDDLDIKSISIGADDLTLRQLLPTYWPGRRRAIYEDERERL